jgi:mono/diheme cytochrome c family protein
VAVGIPAVFAAKSLEIEFIFENPGDADRGREIYKSPAAQCATCHGMDGKGRGIAAWEPSLSKYILRDMWGNLAKPADFTAPPLRGGSTAVDIARSISVGVGGTPMASYGSTLTTLQIADLVAYISSFTGN